MTTVTLKAMGIMQFVDIEHLGPRILTHSEDAEGRIVEHRFDILNRDSPMPVAVYAKSRVLRRKRPKA